MSGFLYTLPPLEKSLGMTLEDAIAIARGEKAPTAQQATRRQASICEGCGAPLQSFATRCSYCMRTAPK